MTPPGLVDAGVIALAAVPAACGSWWTILAALALPAPRASRLASRTSRTVVVIPAHNEESNLPRTLTSLAASDPRPLEVLVVADNCTDDTAGVAAQMGATVLVRDDAGHRGKPYALDFALAELRTRSRQPTAVVFVDADTEVAADCLGWLERRLESGAQVVQAYYQAAPGPSDLSRLRRLALSLVHWARPLGAARLGLGATLKGNGMAFRWDVIADGIGGYGVTEDAAMTLDLARRGIAVAFEPHARVLGLMASDYAAARTQDERWEGGRAGLFSKSIKLALDSAFRGRLDLTGAALEVAAPPLSIVGGLAVASLGLALVTRSASLPLAVYAAGAVSGYVVVGLAAARASRRDLRAFVGLPVFLIHKAGVYARLMTRGAPRQWERTER